VKLFLYYVHELIHEGISVIMG